MLLGTSILKLAKWKIQLAKLEKVFLVARPTYCDSNYMYYANFTTRYKYFEVPGTPYVFFKKQKTNRIRFGSHLFFYKKKT